MTKTNKREKKRPIKSNIFNGPLFQGTEVSLKNTKEKDLSRMTMSGESPQQQGTVYVTKRKNLNTKDITQNSTRPLSTTMKLINLVTKYSSDVLFDILKLV